MACLFVMEVFAMYIPLFYESYSSQHGNMVLLAGKIDKANGKQFNTMPRLCTIKAQVEMSIGQVPYKSTTPRVADLSPVEIST